MADSETVVINFSKRSPDLKALLTEAMSLSKQIKEALTHLGNPTDLEDKIKVFALTSGSLVFHCLKYRLTVEVGQVGDGSKFTDKDFPKNKRSVMGGQYCTGHSQKKARPLDFARLRNGTYYFGYGLSCPEEKAKRYKRWAKKNGWEIEILKESKVIYHELN